MVFDRCTPSALPSAGGFLFLGPRKAPPLPGAEIAAAVKAPKIVEFRESLPVGPTGKVQKKLL